MPESLAGYYFAYPLILFAPLAILALRLVLKDEKKSAFFPDLRLIYSAGPGLRARLQKVLQPLLFWITLIALSLAAARPQRVTYVNTPELRNNLMLVIDISPSMGSRDFAAGSGELARLEGVKRVVAEFIEARADDRIGLVAFGGQAFLQAPLTLDHDLLLKLVSRLQVGLAGDGTAIGDGLGLALKHMRGIEAKAQSIVLLTDGVSNAGQVNPIKAAKVAADLTVKIHTIGIGTSRPLSINVPGGIFPGSAAVKSEYDEETLKTVARLTGGLFLNASDVKQLQSVYSELNRLQGSMQAEPERRIVEELFVPYALTAMAAYLLYIVLAYSVFMKVP